MQPIAEGESVRNAAGGSQSQDQLPRIATPPRDWSEYTLGGDMNDVNGERSMPSTPAVMVGGEFGGGGEGGIGAGMFSPQTEVTPAGWSTVAHNGDGGAPCHLPRTL